MKVYIVKYETLEKLKNIRENNYIGFLKEPKIITKDFDISREGIINAINYK